MSEMQSKQHLFVVAGQSRILSPTAEIHQGLALVLLLASILQNYRTSSVKHSANTPDDQSRADLQRRHPCYSCATTCSLSAISYNILSDGDLLDRYIPWGTTRYTVLGVASYAAGLHWRVFFFFFFFSTREHILNSYCMKEETDMTDYS